MEADKPSFRREFSGSEPNSIDYAKLRYVSLELSRPHKAADFFVEYQLDCLEQIDSQRLDESRLAAFMVRLCRNLIMASDQLAPDESITRLGLEPRPSADLIRWGSQLIGRGDVYDDDREVCRNFSRSIRLLGAGLERHQPIKDESLGGVVAGQLVAANARLFVAGEGQVLTRRTDFDQYVLNLLQAHVLLEA